MDYVDKLLQNPFFLHAALLKAIPKTNDKELLELQTTVLKVNYVNMFLGKENFEIRQQIFEMDQRIHELRDLRGLHTDK
jgi:hypothetical protein